MHGTDGVCLHARTFGDAGHPAVVLLHGFMGSALDWEPVAADLAGSHHVLAVDLPGHGGSTGLPDGAYTMEGVVELLVGLLDAHGWGRAAVVGYSMGGRVALAFAVRYPDRCTRLVLESASPGLETAAERAARCAEDEARAARLEAEGMETFLEAWYRQPLFASLADHDGLDGRLTATRLRNDPGELARVLRGLGTGRQPSLWERLPTLSVATLAVAGTRDAKYAALARRMATAGPCVRAVVVPRAGHNVHAEQPRRFLTLLRTFL